MANLNTRYEVLTALFFLYSACTPVYVYVHGRFGESLDLHLQVVQNSGPPWATLHSTDDTNIKLLRNFGNYLQKRTVSFSELLVYVDPRTIHQHLDLLCFDLFLFWFQTLSALKPVQFVLLHRQFCVEG